FKLLESISLKSKAHEFSEVDFFEFSMAELIWIYEVMSKDFGWIESSTMLEQNLKLLYIKLTLRKQILSKENLTNLDVKKKIISEEIDTAPTKTQDEVDQQEAAEVTKSIVDEIIEEI